MAYFQTNPCITVFLLDWLLKRCSKSWELSNYRFWSWPRLASNHFFFCKTEVGPRDRSDQGIWPTFWDQEMGIHQLGLEGSPKDSKGLWDPRDQFHVSGPFRSFRTLLLPYLRVPWRSYSPIPLNPRIFGQRMAFIWSNPLCLAQACCTATARKSSQVFSKKLGSTTGFTTPLLLGGFIWFT